MAKEGLPLFGLERLTGAFLNVAVGIGALALGASLLRNTFRSSKEKAAEKKKK